LKQGITGNEGVEWSVASAEALSPDDYFAAGQGSPAYKAIIS